jgi:hypothetical protein
MLCGVGYAQHYQHDLEGGTIASKRERREGRAMARIAALRQPPATDPPPINWAVMWLKSGEIIEKWCEDDFTEALRVYDLARERGRKGVTLRSANRGFPPPKKYTEKEVVEVVKRKVKGKVKRFKRTTVVNAIKDLNAQGWVWCPYCIKFRRFELQDGFEFEGMFVPRQGYYCPMCGIPATDFNVRKYNPLAYKYEQTRRTRRSGGRKRKR